MKRIILLIALFVGIVLTSEAQEVKKQKKSKKGAKIEQTTKKSNADKGKNDKKKNVSKSKSTKGKKTAAKSGQKVDFATALKQTVEHVRNEKSCTDDEAKKIEQLLLARQKEIQTINKGPKEKRGTEIRKLAEKYERIFETLLGEKGVYNFVISTLNKKVNPQQSSMNSSFNNRSKDKFGAGFNDGFGGNNNKKNNDPFGGGF